MGGQIVNNQPWAMSGGRCYEKSSSKEKALRVIGRKSESEQCRCEGGNIQGRERKCKYPEARYAGRVQGTDIYGTPATHHP